MGDCPDPKGPFVRPPRSGMFTPGGQIVLLLGFVAASSGMVWFSLQSSDWQQKAKVSEEMNRRLMQARCAEAACALQYDERIIASPGGASLATTVWGTAPIACKQAGHVPWVRPDWDGSGFEFMCLPADGLPIRGAE